MGRKELNRCLERLRQTLEPENEVALLFLEVIEMLMDRREEEESILIRQRIDEYLFKHRRLKKED